METLINFNYQQIEQYLINIKSDIQIDQENQHLFPLNIGHHIINFNNHKIIIKNCINWKGVFILQGGEIKNLNLEYDKSNSLYLDQDNHNYGAILVYSSLNDSAYGKLTNINGLIETNHDLYGTLVGNYACCNYTTIFSEQPNQTDFNSKYKLIIKKIALKIKAKEINGCIVGPRYGYGAKWINSKIDFEEIILNIETDLFYGLLVGNEMGINSHEKSGISFSYSGLVYKIIGKTVTDDFGQKNNYIFGINNKEDLKIAIIVGVVSTEQLIKHPILEGN